MKRITTSYSDSEDRIRLTALTDQDTPLILWLTRRLMDRLIPQLCAWLEPPKSTGPNATRNTPDADLQQTLNRLTQQRLRTTSEPVPPVTSTPETRSHLVHSIDITKHPNWIRLTFKDQTGHPFGVLVLEPVPLRQWLNIFYDQYRAAQWSTAAWPEWMTGQGIEVGVIAGQEVVWH